MRYSPEHKQATRRKILDAALVVFRREGFEGAGVDAVMAEAGLTAGGFYAHFKSKEALFAEALVDALQNARLIRGLDDEGTVGPDRIRRIVGKYLSPAHRRFVTKGCPMPPLLGDLARQDEPVRRDFETVLLDVVGSLAPHLAGGEPTTREDHGLSILATLIGGLSLSRAVADDALGERILAACRTMIEATLTPASHHKTLNSEP
jgi:TetR/AcrR family transcriptional regulator, transcriptional repressor for nem operon